MLVFYAIAITLLSSPIWVSIVARRLRRKDGLWLNILAACLIFLPGLTTAAAFLYVLLLIDGISRLVFFLDLIQTAWRLFRIVWFFTGIILLIWAACELVYARRHPQQRRSRVPNIILRWTVPVVFTVTAAAAYYFATYRTLEDAVQSGDLELTRKRLAFNLLGVDANNGRMTRFSAGTFTDSLLPIAAGAGDQAMVRLLLEHGAIINPDYRRYFSGGGAIGTAAYHGNLPMVRLLLSYGANPNDGITGAVHSDSAEILDILLDHGADPRRCLAPASEHGNVDILRHLVEQRGIHPQPVPLSEPTVLDIALRHKHVDAVRYLYHFTHEFHDLRALIDCDQLEVFERALAGGIVPDAETPQTSCDDTLLHYAVEQEKAAFVLALLEAGADPLPAGRSGAPLRIAVEKDNIDLVKMLLYFGAPVNALNGSYRSALDIAVKQNETPDIAKLLRDAGGMYGRDILDQERYRRRSKPY